MAIDHQLFPTLHRLFLNGRFKEVNRGNDDLYTTSLSERWLRLQGEIANQASDWDKAKQWQSILHGIIRTASIIFGSNRYQIVLDAGYDENYYYKPQRTVVVSTEPIKYHPPGFSFYDAMDTMTGQVIHEAAHLRERQSDETRFEDDEIMALLYHLVEDIIIDQIVAIEYPGFEGYLLKYRRYFIDWKLRSKWSFLVEGRLQQLILAMRSTLPVRITRWTVRHAYLYLIYHLSKHRTVSELRTINRAELTLQLYAILYATKQADHWREPDALSESFVLGVMGPPVKGEKGHNRGGKEVNPITHQSLLQLDTKELDWLDAKAPIFVKEVQPRKSHGKLILMKSRWNEDYRHQTLSTNNHQALSAEVNGLMLRLMEENPSPLKGANGKYAYQAQLSLLPLHAQANERYKSAVDAVRSQIVQLRNQLAWANGISVRDDVSLKSGDLDEEALYRAKFAADLFKRSSTSSCQSADLDIVLLVDASYSMKKSMSGAEVSKYMAAQRLTAMFVEVFEPLQSIHTWVFSFSSHERTVDIRELYSPDAHADKARIGDLYPTNLTPEYKALLAMSQHIRATSRLGVRKVFIVLSDGCPEDDIIPSDVQVKEIKMLVKRLHAEGDMVYIKYSQAKSMYAVIKPE